MPFGTITLPISGLLIFSPVFVSQHRGAAVDADNLAGHETRLVARQIGRHARHFFLGARASHRDHAHNLFNQFWIALLNVSILRRHDRAGRDGVDRDAIARKFAREARRHAVHAALGGVVASMVAQSVEYTVGAEIYDASPAERQRTRLNSH